MSSQNFRVPTITAAATAVAVLMTAPAYAFNPQPDPPAKIQKSIEGGGASYVKNKGTTGRASKVLIEDPNLKVLIDDPNLRNAKSKGAVGRVTDSPGLLEGNSGFSAQGPSATGTPATIGGARPGAAGR